jgi:hypothetical protein
MAKIHVSDVARKNYAALDSGDKVVLRLADLASLTKDNEYLKSYSVFRVPPKALGNKELVDVDIRSEDVVCFNNVCYKASYKK